MITVVLSVNRRQFLDWCRLRECSPNDPKIRSVVYFDDLPKLRGLNQPIEVKVTGSFWEENRRAEELHEEVEYVRQLNADRPDPDPPRPWSWTITP